ncbi:B3/B4 domain-containing protein [Pantoea piersonii]|uniref:B3/B4 domain-containing protein n=1 Tax=Pantoea piersonii TaxID=2364647 RepID=UPI000EA0508E|nr:B3/4 domain-containing protein [Pantoea piersonii]MBZ6388696.1 B3/4 domain-containing protein [Pantoea piersonii]MBZ6402480.1 B3/4 domain-containing protein [Pantoea piersonii]MBZ6410667.1 B3/4 domain-containing protein [Pantoea piersonii]MBZ6429311.1 B3/4 domain-containing protein [Pantoea piersonii]NYB04629.1 B3/4 domain-containing protein [Pantoea piersonii]
MLTASPSISAEIYRIAPGFRALSICVESAPVADKRVGEVALREACEVALAGQPVWAEAHLSAWADVFRSFGAKPKRTPCSAEALRKRAIKDGMMAALDPVVDLYNAVSIRYAVPVGGENFAAYAGMPRLVVADGTEIFDTIKDGQPGSESPEAGEVIWRDDTGVTCRRWNWRQGIRTRLSVSDSNMWFILESLPEMPLEELHAAGRMLTEGLEKIMPGARCKTVLISNESSDAE